MHVCGEDEPGSRTRNGRCRHAGPCAGSATGNRSAGHGGHAHRAVESSAVADGRAALRLECGPALAETRQLERSLGQTAAALGIPLARAISHRLCTSCSQAGDLVFLDSELHYVEICIGNGLGVWAPPPGENIRIVRIADSRADFYGVTRLT